MADFAAMRAHMVDRQIRPNKVADPRLLAALRRVPRERFVPEARRGVAYVDDDLELAAGRWLMAPTAFARLVAEAGVGEGDTVLDIGCATGYSTAVLGLVAAAAVGVEPRADFAARAGGLLAALGIDNAVVVERAPAEGCAEHAPYDAIVVAGAVDAAPEALLDQLAEGGRLVAVLRGGGAGRAGKAVLWLRTGGHASRRTLFDAAAAPLPGFARSAGFVF